MLITDVKKCESGFTIMYDETTNAKNDKQMDILIRYWLETTGQVETKYLASLTFARATAETLQEMLMGLQNDEVLSDLPWEKFCNVSSDGPHINKKLWRLINSELLKEGKHGLMRLLVCNISSAMYSRRELMHMDSCVSNCVLIFMHGLNNRHARKKTTVP